MKGLNQFLFFNWEAFAEGKSFVVIGVSEYLDFDTKEHLGTKVDCVIAVDKTPYKFKDGNTFSNRFEKISFKVSKDINVPIDSRVMPKNVVATVWKEKETNIPQLSVKCEDLAIAIPKEK